MAHATDRVRRPGAARPRLGNPLSTVRRLAAPPAEPIAVDGAMKVPGLRNVALTARYFHNGGFLTLRQVLAFYSRGGDVVPQYSANGRTEVAPLNVLASTEDERDALEAFLRALTDERVRDRRVTACAGSTRWAGTAARRCRDSSSSRPRPGTGT